MSDIVLTLLTISVTVSLILTLILCICRNKSKSNSGVNNVNHLLPLNSIRSSDLQTNQLELIRYNGVNGLTVDEVDYHLKPHTQRALPDIPSVANTSDHLVSNEFHLNRDSIQPNEVQHNIEVKGRPPKARAPQPPTHLVMTCPTIPTSDDLHHSYARIKDNAVVDSSENETDDYCDPHFCTTSVRNMSHDSDDMSPPVPTKRYVNESNDMSFRVSNATTSRVADEMVFMNGPVLLLNHSNVDTVSHSSNEENRIHSIGTEISYNTISVREPLAKVLAERANTEHHYNEVEEERVSSFYEEIAGSTASSVTYSKIGDILSNNLMQNSIHKTEGVVPNVGPVLHSFPLDSTNSVSTQPKQLMTTITPNCDSFLVNNPKDLYSSVDKKMKKSYNRQTIHSVPDSDNEVDNLYAKVQKVHNKPKDITFYANQRPSSVCEVEPTDLPESNIPPPLPPPLKPYQSTQPRTARTISLYDSYTSAPNTSSHQRRYSSGNQSINTNDWQKRDINEELFNYATVGSNDIELENDPGYEVIHKKSQATTKSGPSLPNGYHSESIVDPEYEAIRYDESDCEPNYEVITKKVNPKRQMTEMVDPGYEVIKRVPQIEPKVTSSRFEVNRTISDVSSEPGYERIRFTQKTVQQIESEPNYASISRTEPFYDHEEEQTLSERL